MVRSTRADTISWYLLGFWPALFAEVCESGALSRAELIAKMVSVNCHINADSSFIQPTIRTWPSQKSLIRKSFPLQYITNTLPIFAHYYSQGVRTKTVKKSARTIVEKYYPRLTLDFHTNKRIIDEIAITPSKRMRNKIAGFTTHLMKRIAKGPVRNISLKLQEEERERRLDFVPEVSALEQETIAIDRETRDLLESMGYGSLSGVVVSNTADRS